jgi:phenylacetic acid degradation operon negative regulatory protein
MQNPLFQSVLNSFLERTPLRVGSLIVTIFGDAVLPYGEFVRLTALLEIASNIGIDDGAVRVAIHRLEKEGWLKKSKIGRNAFYALSKAGEAQSREASKLIYGFGEPLNAGNLQMLIMAEGPGRADARKTLLECGWGLIAANIVLTSGSQDQLSALNGLSGHDRHYLVHVEADNNDILRLCSRAWSLENLNNEYRIFGQLYQPIADEVRSGRKYSKPEALMLRVLMIHDYRRLIFKDPFLASSYLPDNWQGTDTREIVSTMYPVLKQRSKDWI